MLMYISINEDFPIFKLTDTKEFGTKEIEVSKRWYRRYLVLMAEYEALQKELGSLWNESK